jgi:hypothetical protein
MRAVRQRTFFGKIGRLNLKPSATKQAARMSAPPAKDALVIFSPIVAAENIAAHMGSELREMITAQKVKDGYRSTSSRIQT